MTSDVLCRILTAWFCDLSILRMEAAMKKENNIAAILLSVVSAVAVAAAVMIICRRLFEKKYFNVND